MSNFLGLDDQIVGDIRLNGIGWIGAMLVVGVSILAARFVMHWRLRRVERILASNEAEEAAGKRELTDKHESPSV
jgi:hypothetical protein